MIIYIYGNDEFKKEIHSVLNHANIKFRLGENGEIKDLKTLEELKEAIEDNPNNIYLIDDDKIIKKNSLNQKIKFLKPKDGIEQEYLLDHGIGDLSIDSIDELSKHIIKKLELSINEKESNDIQESIVEIVEDAYENSDFIELDDELSTLLTKEKDTSTIEQIDEISLLEDDMQEELEQDSNISKQDLNFEEDSDNILNSSEELYKEQNIEEIENEMISQGDDMEDEFSEFDTLKEDDILSALDINNDTKISPAREKESISASSVPSSSEESINISSSNVNDIAELISKLLNNKTLEITVKVKE